MRKLLLFFTLIVCSLAFGQEDVPYSVLGVWVNGDGEAVRITREVDQVVFQRRNASGILAAGTITMVDGELHIVRADCKDEYSLAFFVGNETMVISKPRSTSAWLWNKVE